MGTANGFAASLAEGLRATYAEGVFTQAKTMVFSLYIL